MIEKIARFYIRFPWLVLLVAAALAWFAFEQSKTLNINTNLQALMPDNVPSVENLEKVLEKTGSFSSAMVVISSPDPDAAVEFAADMRRKVLLEMDWVGSADYAEDFSLFTDRKLLYLSLDDLNSLKDYVEEEVVKRRDEIIERLAGLPVNIKLRTQPGPRLTDTNIDEIREKLDDPDSPVLGKGTERVFQSDDKEVTLLVVWPKTSTMGLNFSRRILGDLERAAAELEPKNYHPEMTVGVGGRIYNRVVQFDAVISDVKKSGIISAVLIILLLTFFYRSLMAVFYLVVPLATGIIWTFGVAAYVIGSLNLITVFLVLILFGLGIDFGIHSLSRYREAKISGASVEGALVTIMKRTGAASLMAGLTTAIGFISLLITDFRAFYEFGFIAGIGIMLTFISTYTILPPLLVLAEKYGIYRTGQMFISPFRFKGQKFPRPRTVLRALLVLFVISAVFATQMEFEKDFGKLQASRSDAHKELGARIAKVFPDGTDRAVLIVNTLPEVKAITDYLNEYIENDTETPTIRKVDSIFSYVPDKEEQRERLDKINEIKDSLGGIDFDLEEEGLGEGELDDYLNISEVTPDDLPEGLQRVYKGLPDTPGYLMYIFNSVSMYQADLARQFADDIREIEVGGNTYYPATEALIFVDMLKLMKGEALIAILAVSSVTFLMLLVFFRSVKNALLVLSPTLAGLLILFGLAGLFDIHLSIFNMVILPTIIGIGVDNGIHIVHRCREEHGSIMKVLFTTGSAAGVATLTTALGFAGMLTARMGGFQSLGLLAVLGLAACLLTTWTLLPALLQLKEKDLLAPDHLPFEGEN